MVLAKFINNLSTGTGGRIRDTHATGKGSLVQAATVGYCVGNLNIPNYNLPWEDKEFAYPTNIANPLKIEIEASNGTGIVICQST